MSKRIPEIISIALVILSLVTFALLLAIRPGPNHAVEARYGDIIHEESSDFSTIRIRENGSMRSLLFVDPEGREQCQSSIDLDSPGELVLGYSKTILASHFFIHPQERVLVVGLGAGGMVQFMNYVFPETFVEAVEIDPVVVRLADQFFGTKDSANLKIHTADAFDFLEKGRGKNRFDVIYMDAFLRAPESTGLDEKTKRLKTVSFLRGLRENLSPGGVVAFNLIEAEYSTLSDIEAITEVFGKPFLFSVPRTGNLVAIAEGDGEPRGFEDLKKGKVGISRSSYPGIDFDIILESLRE